MDWLKSKSMSFRDGSWGVSLDSTNASVSRMKFGSQMENSVKVVLERAVQAVEVPRPDRGTRALCLVRPNNCTTDSDTKEVSEP